MEPLTSFSHRSLKTSCPIRMVPRHSTIGYIPTCSLREGFTIESSTLSQIHVLTPYSCTVVIKVHTNTLVPFLKTSLIVVPTNPSLQLQNYAQLSATMRFKQDRQSCTTFCGYQGSTAVRCNSAHPSVVGSEPMDINLLSEQVPETLDPMFFSDLHFLTVLRTFQDHLHSGWLAEDHRTTIDKYRAGVQRGHRRNLAHRTCGRMKHGARDNWRKTPLPVQHRAPPHRGPSSALSSRPSPATGEGSTPFAYTDQ